MSLSALSPYELGESNHEDAIPYLVHYLKDVTDNEKKTCCFSNNEIINKVSL
ncbi:hypothetical protein [Neobacillus niacini]|uniref:hypothetical protein n=1 Tax=Neobacillus niacini TaxID=86668 RepID=UPI003983B015